MKCKITKCNNIAFNNNYCEYHFYKRERDDKCIRRAKEKGMCVRCFKTPHNITSYYCDICANKKSQKQKESLEDLKRKGICKQCWKSPAILGRRKCKICWFKAAAVKHFGSVQRWEELSLLFENQSICPYSRVKLRAGITATLDHKIPTCRAKDFGLNDPNDIGNLHWVYKSDDKRIDLNKIKHKLTHNEFKNLINLLGWDLKDKIRLLEAENAQLKEALGCLKPLDKAG
jgi:hypothetical protein